MTSSSNVLILGGSGRIGRHVAADLMAHTEAAIAIAGRHPPSSDCLDFLPRPVQFAVLDLDADRDLADLVRDRDLVIHCAGPFHYRDGRVLLHCIEAGVNYLDVSDHRSFVRRALPLHQQAIASGVTAVLNAGVFPGISNSIVRQGIEQLDTADRIHLSYVVAGSGGAGLTVMRTTFLGLRDRFMAWLGGQWQLVVPYTQREVLDFGAPFGKAGVYWFDVPETFTFPESFGVQSVITKFGSIPDFYNYLTWMTAHIFPESWVKSPKGIEFFSKVSYRMTAVTDRFSGIGVAMRAAISGQKDGRNVEYCALMNHDNMAIAAGAGAGMVAQALLSGQLCQPGVYPIERAFPTSLFKAGCRQRAIDIREIWQARP